MNPYLHTIQYYETDMMGIVHHSNYIRWFEEARCDLLNKLGIPYALHEKEGILSPVLSVNINYLQTMTYGQTARVEVFLLRLTGVKYTVGYRVYNNETDTLCVTGETGHCYVDQNFKPISIKRVKPEWFEMLKKLEVTENEKS